MDFHIDRGSTYTAVEQLSIPVDQDPFMRPPRWRSCRYYPAALEAFDDLHDRDALAVLGRAPTPAEAAHLSLAKIRSALKRAGRQRNLDARAQEIAAALRIEQLAAPSAITAAFAATTRAAVGIIIELNRQITDLEAELATHFETHPDADIYLSLPGLGVILGARVLGEFGDDPDRATPLRHCDSQPAMGAERGRRRCPSPLPPCHYQYTAVTN